MSNWSPVGLASLGGLGAALMVSSGCVDLSRGSESHRPEVATTVQAIRSMNGVMMNGAGSNGLNFNGLNLNGLNFNGLNFNGTSINGLNFNGLFLNGLNFNGLFLNGLNFNGLNFNGLNFNGVHFNGLNFNGLNFNGLNFNGAPLTSAQGDSFDEALAIMTECALPAGECISAYDLDGVEQTYCGVLGHDPGWGNSEPDLGKYDVMAQCVIERGTVAGHTVTHQAVNVEALKVVLRYLIECALPEGTSVTIYDEHNDPMIYYGALGLAPEWETGSMSSDGQKLVSACLAARTNYRGQTVQISLRGGGLPVTPVEERLFAQHEGAFAADLFAANPYVKSCDASGGISGRICASDAAACGFTPIGDCDNTCNETNENGVYSDCDSGAETNVISTFLALDRSMAFGEKHTCMRRLDGSVACWGDNTQGQLGIGSESAETILTPQPVVGLTWKSDALTSSNHHTCTRDTDGGLRCWGMNSNGQLGDGTTVSQATPVIVASLGLDVAQTSVADLNTCAVTTAGELWCWGSNAFGQLGDGSTSGQLEPQQVPGIAGAVKVATGRHTCALNAAGDVSCWGHNDVGQVGDGSTSNQHAPVSILTGTSVDVCVGYKHSCALHYDGTVQCWGENTLGQLGNGTSTSQSTPSDVIGLFADATSIGCGYDHTCARLKNGTLWCWGSNTYGQIGKGSLTLREKTPVQVADIADVRDLVVGRDYGCAQLADRSFKCWGWNGYGQLGDGSTVDAAAPVAMSHYSCGDGVCDAAAEENRLNCPADCATCGDGSCDPTEDCSSCATDCGSCNCAPCQITDCGSCGVSATGECNTCTVTDCALCSGAICGDQVCDPSEDCNSCEWDCGTCGPICGNGTCEAGEDCGSCSADCGTCPTCEPVDGFCEEDSECCSGRCRERRNKCRE